MRSDHYRLVQMLNNSWAAVSQRCSFRWASADSRQETVRSPAPGGPPMSPGARLSDQLGEKGVEG